MIENLIWIFKTNDTEQSVIWHEGKFVHHTLKILNYDENTTSVKLWHPALAEEKEIGAWQSFLIHQKIIQPFKQAYREFYIANDKIQTHTTLFASHVLQQNKFHSLCRQKGWQYTLQGDFDSPETANIFFKEYNIRAELTLDREDHPLTDMGVYKYVTSDRLRFFSNDVPIALSEIPPVLLSEIMRDTDLFVSVSGIKNNVDINNFDNQLFKYWPHFHPKDKK